METWQAGESDRQEEGGSDAVPLSDATIPRSTGSAAGRKRAAVEIVARHGRSLKQTARRYSLCAEDAEDAYQRALEILLTKAPTDRIHELIRWTHTVVKHEALAVRRNRERLLGATPVAGDEEGTDWLALIPAPGDGPDMRAERSEKIARSREALQSLKPAELRALTLLAEGYSYTEIGRITGFSQTKVNRCLAEGRERFRRLLAHSEDGSRCTEIGPALSAFCDGETSAEESAAIREHLRACASCRATLRAYRAAPGAAAALVPALFVTRSLLERVHETFSGLTSRLPGMGSADSTVAQVATAGGTRGAGMAALAKVLAVCAGAAGGAAACVATGVAPIPADLTPNQVKSPTIERASELVIDEVGNESHKPAPPQSQPAPKESATPVAEAPEEAAPEPPAETTGAVEYTEPPPPPAATESSASSGSAAGEFGP
jgi:RNA polymerase sigma factor (sigma-70 family)